MPFTCYCEPALVYLTAMFRSAGTVQASSTQDLYGIYYMVIESGGFGVADWAL